MSDTPRTDDFLAHRGHDGIDQFTRGMERENAKLRALLQECRDDIEGLDHGEGAPGMSSYQREMVRDLDLVLANAANHARSHNHENTK